jgi:NADH:ubiquinone oxidoreductase subunit 6 (subunit J)
VLRSIENKILGVVAMLGSLLILLALPILDTGLVRTPFRPRRRFAFWAFVGNFLLLRKLGSVHVEEPFVRLGQRATAFYFSWFLIILPTIGIIENTLFELRLKVLALLCALLAVSSKTTVSAILLLIALFRVAAGYLCAAGASYLGLVYIIVYVGAISVLFLFVIMRLDLGNNRSKRNTRSTAALPLGALIVLRASYLPSGDILAGISTNSLVITPSRALGWEAIQNIALSLYSNGAIWLALLSVLFLIGMVGPIVLCLKPNNT